MDHYQDIRVLPDPEFSESMLMTALFAKLHRALAADGKGEIGISFPHLNKQPGDTLRLHGCAVALTRLEATHWRKGLTDYVTVTAVQAVPAGVQYRTFSRVQVKSSAPRLRRRAVRKGWLTEQQALTKIPLTREQRTSLPFIMVRSLSSGQSFRLFMRPGKLQNTAVAGIFSFYGFSVTATVPWF